MNKYKIEIKYQTREYSDQNTARLAMIELLEAGVFHVKTETENGKTILICKGENSTYSDSSSAVNALLRALKTHKIFYVETHIMQESNNK